MQIRKILVFSILTLLLLIGIDIAVSRFFNGVFKKLESGRYHKNKFTLYENTSELLVVGSSVGEDGIYPPILADTLGMTCWNGSREGQTILFYLAVAEKTLERYKPKLVVQLVEMDHMETAVEKRGVERLKPFAHTDPELRKYIYYHNRYRRWLAFSGLVSYNSIYLHLWRPLLHKADIYPPDGLGFIPNSGRYTIPPSAKTDFSDYVMRPLEDTQIDLHTKLLDKYSQANVPLVLVMVPYCTPGPSTTSTIEKLKEWDKEREDMILLNYWDDKRFVGHTEFFYNDNHLNTDGAMSFTKIIAHDIKEWLKQHPDWLDSPKGISTP